MNIFYLTLQLYQQSVFLFSQDIPLVKVVQKMYDHYFIFNKVPSEHSLGFIGIE